MHIRTQILHRAVGLAGLLVGLAVSVPAEAQQIMSTQGGPVLTSFTIYPYYYGAGWGADTNAPAIVAQQKVVTDIAAYISRHNVPANIQTVISQYGVTSAAVAPAVLGPAASPPPQGLSEADIQSIIRNGMVAAPPHRLHGWGSNVLIFVF